MRGTAQSLNEAQFARNERKDLQDTAIGLTCNDPNIKVCITMWLIPDLDNSRAKVKHTAVSCYTAHLAAHTWS